MSNKEDRIAKLSQRFKQHATGRRKVSAKRRERQSFYLDTVLTEQIDSTYKEISHQLYPKPLSKSIFLETLLEYGLENIKVVKSRLSKTEEIGEGS